jgi:hypothetical protein
LSIGPHLLKISPDNFFSPSNQCFYFSFSGLGIRSTKGRRRIGKKQDESFYILPNVHRLTKAQNAPFLNLETRQTKCSGADIKHGRVLYNQSFYID